MLIAGINYAQNLSIKIGAYQKWKELYTHSFNETFDIQQYCDISIILHSDASFWYNFSAELYFRKKYQECLYALNHAAMLNNNTDIQILKGLCYQEMKDYCSAKKHYISAHNMCPKLFKPLYLLAKMYEQIGDTTRASKIAIQIINKKVKIQSFEIEEMKTDVKQLIIP